MSTLNSVGLKLLSFIFLLLPLSSELYAKNLGAGKIGEVFHIHHFPDPVNPRTGNFYLPIQDYFQPCFGFPLEIYRSYNSVSTRNGPFGRGWTFNYDVQIVVDERADMNVVEADGFINEYKPIELEKENKENVIQKILESRKKEDIKYLGKPDGKGAGFYNRYKRRLQTDEAFLKRQRTRYLPLHSKISKSGKYVSHSRGTTYLEKTSKGFLRTTESSRKEEYNSRGFLTRVSDRHENEIQLTYGKESRLSRVHDGCGQYLQISYNSSGKITSIRDSLNRKLAYQYDAQDRLILASRTTGEKTRFGYDKKHRLTSIEFGKGTKTTIAYDPKKGRVIKQVGPGKKVTTYQYGKSASKTWTRIKDNQGLNDLYEFLDSDNKTVFTDKNGKKVITIVSSCCGKPISIKNERGFGDEFRYDEKYRLISKTNSKKQTTTFRYDPRTSFPTEIRAHDNSFIRFLYDKKGNLTFARKSNGEYVKLRYEKHGKVQSMVDHKDVAIAFDYNRIGKPIRIAKSIKGKKTESIQIAYDRMGEILQVDLHPNRPETEKRIKETLANFLELLQPAGIDLAI